MTQPLTSTTAIKFLTPVLPQESSPVPSADNIILQKMNKEPLTLTPLGQEHIEKVLLEKRNLNRCTWSLHHLLQKLCGYFSRTFRGTEVEMTSGTLYLAGTNFWKTCLEERFQTESSEDAESWCLSNDPPACFEIYFCLPQKKVSEEDFNRFIDLCIYVIAMEGMPQPLSDIEALREFGRISHPDPEETMTDAQAERMSAIAARMEEIKGVIKKDRHAIEIPFFNSSSLKIIFSFSASKKNEPFALQFSLESLTPQLICNIPPRQALAEIAARKVHTQGKDRMLAYCFNDPSLRSFFDPAIEAKEVQALTPLGLFLYRYTFLPDSNVKAAVAVLTLVGFLQDYLTPASDQIPCTKLQGEHLEISWKSSSSTLFLRVPVDPESSLKLVCQWLKQNKKESLACLDQALSIFFSSFNVRTSKRPPHMFPEAAEICEAMRGQDSSSFVWFLASCAAGWKNVEAEDLLALPSYLCSMGSKGRSEQVLSYLEAVYQENPHEPLFTRIKRRIEAMDEISLDGIRLACLRELTVCRENKILPAVWKMWLEFCSTLPPLRAQSLTIEICSRVSLDGIPFAVARVCEMCNLEKSALEPTYKMQLLVACLDRLLALPSNEQMMAGYAPALVREIEGLLQLNPLLDSRINPFQRVRNYLRPAAEPAAVLEEKAPDDIWESLLERQASAHPQNFDQLVLDFNQALRSTEGQLHNRKGFFQFLKWIVETLLEKKNCRAVLSLLKHIRVKKGDTYYHAWIQTCLEQLMEEKTPIEKFIPYAAQFRESDVHFQISQDFLLKLFEYLVRNAHTENKITEDGVRKEIKFLHDLLKPEGKGIASFTKCLLIYYPTLLEERFALQLIEGISGHYQLLKDQLETVVSPLFDLLKKLPKDVKLWDKFSKLVEKLKANPEYVLTLYESLTDEAFLARSSILDPPLQMICKGIANFEKKLSVPQKVRLAKVLAALLDLAQKEKKEGELLSSFASIEAFLGYVQGAETLPSFARLFLDYALKRKITPLTSQSFCSFLLWIAPYALSEGTMIRDFRTVLGSVPLKDFKTAAAEWKRVIAGVVSRTDVDPSSAELNRFLIELSTGEERRFFERCRGLYEARAYPALQTWMGSYHTTGTLPKAEAAPAINYRSAIEKFLSGTPTDEVLNKALILLSKCSDEQYDLWEKFFSLLSLESFDLSARAWKLWLEKHPPEKARPEDGKYWEAAVCGCLTKQADMEPFDHFLIHHLPVLVERLPAGNCQAICKTFLQIGINSCWSQPSLKCSPKLKALCGLIQSAAFKTKTGGLNDLIDFESRVRFYLLMARQKELSMQDAGHLPFLSMVMSYGIAHNPTFDGNMVLLQNFCTLPHLPEHARSQQIFHEWIEQSWKALKSTLSWRQALCLIEVLSELNYPEYDAENIFPKWEEIVSGVWETRPSATLFERIASPVYSSRVALEQITSPRPIKALSDATRKMIERLLGKEIDPRRRTHHLLAVNSSVKQFMQRYHPRPGDIVAIAPLYLHLAKCSLENISDLEEDRETTRVALMDILNYLPVLTGYWTSDCISSTEAFISFMPKILALGALNPDLMDPILQIINLYMETARIRSALPESVCSWTQLLASLCSSVSFIRAPYRKRIAQIAVEVFTQCTHQARLKKRAKIPSQDQKTILGLSNLVMALQFLSLPQLECLEPEDWRELFSGLSEAHLHEMLVDLDQEDKLLIHHISIARIIRYAASLRSEVLLPYLLKYASNLRMVPQDALSLHIRCHYIHACSAFLKKERSKQVDKLRDRLIEELIQAFFKGINEENHLKFRKILKRFIQGNGSTVVEKLKKGYVIPANVPTSLRESLLEIKVVDIESRLQNLAQFKQTIGAVCKTPPI